MSPSIPRVGMLATVRGRRALIVAVEPFPHAGLGVLHLTTVEYLDSDGGAQDRVLWEREPGRELVEPRALPDPGRDGPMPPAHLDALVRAARWTAVEPYVDPDGSGPVDRLPITAPFHGAVQVEDFQLVPLLKALRMPRIALLIADDVGLGKTIEAGLLLQELVLRRRVRRVLVLCPASLRTQWVQELHDKFALTSEQVTREGTHKLRKRLGLDASPWRTFARVVCSYQYLRQPDVLEEFRADAKARQRQDAAQLPWDLLIVDEAHNLAPAPFGVDSDLAQMLRAIAPYFEHRLFLTATPHNGHTRSFTGLLESLDPVRFTQTSELTEAERDRLGDVLVRRLKREINARTTPPRFCERTIVALPLHLHRDEARLSEAFRGFRKKVRGLVARRSEAEQTAGRFAVEVLNKRLLSSPTTFADSWRRYHLGLGADEAKASEVCAARDAAAEDTGDDREMESRTAHAAVTVGAWLRPLADQLADEMAEIDSALARLGLARGDTPPVEIDPTHDARFDALVRFIEEHLRAGGKFRADERLIVFTEYKTTLDAIARRLSAKYADAGAVRTLFGTGMDAAERDAIKDAFNDPADAVRILIATDAASEGLNLQETARYLLHWDVPWNPSRLEQRNGRLDRHGQARDVVVHHFATDDEADLAFLAYVVGKVDTIREDLGATGEVFEAGFARALVGDESLASVRGDLERRVEEARARTALPRSASDEATGEVERAALESLRGELDLDPSTLRTTLEVALAAEGGGGALSEPDENGRVTLSRIPARWGALVDESLRVGGTRKQVGSLPKMVFDPDFFLDRSRGRPVFRPRRDTVLVHLAHPVFQRALGGFARARFPGSDASASRWTVRRAPMPAGADALVLLTVEELAVNELRESFHHWVRTLVWPVRGGDLLDLLPHEPARALALPPSLIAEGDARRAIDVWDEVAADVRDRLATHATALGAQLRELMVKDHAEALGAERARFQSRHGELSRLIQTSKARSAEQRRADIDAELRQQGLFGDDPRIARLRQERTLIDQELDRRDRHWEELRDQLASERDRVLEKLLPKRYDMRGEPQVLPVAVEIRLPEVAP